MKNKTCCFFGHRTINESEKLKSQLAEVIEKLIERFEEDDDVQNVFHNMKEEE